MHLGQFAVAGVGLLITEATAVTPEGRISPGCLGLWNDEQEQALKRVVGFCQITAYKDGDSACPCRAQRLNRYALGWRQAIAADDARGWQNLAPSATPYAEGWDTPTALDEEGMNRLIDAFVQSAIRADR